jgi:Tfp pilus assembly PilM family ATPase
MGDKNILLLLDRMEFCALNSTVLSYVKNMDRNKFHFDILVAANQLGSMEKQFSNEGCNVFCLCASTSDRKFKTKFAEFFNEVENLGREVRRTCEYYLINKKDARFTHLVLAGGGANMAGLSEFLSEGMEMKVVVNDLRQAVTFADKLDQRELKKYLGALTVAIGAALYGGEADD